MRVETKFIEVRDNGTFIPAVATRYVRDSKAYGDEMRPDWLMHRGGFGKGQELIVLTHLQSLVSHGNIFAWADTRTMRAVHEHLYSAWYDIEDGALIDVRVVHGEADEPCESELAEDA